MDRNLEELKKLSGPTIRPLKVYASDPSGGRLLGNSMTVRVDYQPLERDPIGEQLAVIDYDGARKTFTNLSILTTRLF